MVTLVFVYLFRFSSLLSSLFPLCHSTSLPSSISHPITLLSISPDQLPLISPQISVFHFLTPSSLFKHFPFSHYLLDFSVTLPFIRISCLVVSLFLCKRFFKSHCQSICFGSYLIASWYPVASLWCFTYAEYLSVVIGPTPITSVCAFFVRRQCFLINQMSIFRKDNWK